MQCPKCGNTNLQIITETETKGKDFSATKGCCGAVLFGWIGILCGACGKEKEPILQVIGYVLIADTGLKHEQR